jgi:hypothetical protein
MPPIDDVFVLTEWLNLEGRSQEVVIAAAPTLAPLIKRWKLGLLSLRKLGPYGGIRDVSEEEYREATALAHPRRKKASAHV